MSHPAPAGARRPRHRSVVDRVRCLAARIGKIVRAAHSASVPF